MKRGECMDEAKAIITKDRAATHGNPEDTFARIAKLWSAYLDIPVKPHDVAALMNLLKVARIKGNPKHIDNWVDGAGYMGCGVELITEEPPTVTWTPTMFNATGVSIDESKPLKVSLHTGYAHCTHCSEECTEIHYSPCPGGCDGQDDD